MSHNTKETINKPKYTKGQKLLMIYGDKSIFKITGVFYKENGEIFYSYKNWYGWGNTESESRMEDRIIKQL